MAAQQGALRWYSSLLSTLYECIEDESSFQRFLHHLCQCIGAAYGAIWIEGSYGADTGRYFIGSAGADAQWPDDLYSTIPMLSQQTLQTGSGQDGPVIFMPIDRRLGKGGPTVRSDAPLSRYYSVGLVSDSIDGRRCVTVLYRRGRRGAFGDADLEALQGLASHIGRVINVWLTRRQWLFECRYYAESMSLGCIGVVLLNQNGSICKTNAVADAILQEDGGISRQAAELVFSTRKLTADFHDRVGRMRQAMRQPVVGVAEAALSVPHASGCGHYELVLRPLPMGLNGGFEPLRHLVLLISSQDRHREIALERLMALYPFTRAEAKVVRVLLDGRRVDEIAALLSVARTTVRAHLRAIFWKTGVTRQSSLVSLVLRGLAHDARVA